MSKSSPKAQGVVKKTMEKFKEGKLTSGKSGKKVTSKRQAVAIGLSEARQKGLKTPRSKKS